MLTQMKALKTKTETREKTIVAANNTKINNINSHREEITNMLFIIILTRRDHKL